MTGGGTTATTAWTRMQISCDSDKQLQGKNYWWRQGREKVIALNLVMLLMLEALPCNLTDYWAKGPVQTAKKTSKKLFDPWNK